MSAPTHSGRGTILVVLQIGLIILLAAPIWPDRCHGRIALALLAVAALLVIYVLFHNRPGNFAIRPEVRPGARLIVDGPYRFVRHPMYTALLIAAIAAVIYRCSLVAGALAAALYLVLFSKSAMEEAALTRRFPDYSGYRSRTGRFLPRLRR